MKKVLFLISTVLLAGVAAAQCPMCKTAMKSGRDKNGNNVGNGINKGILFLLTAPYVMVGTVGVIWYRSRKQK